MLIECEFFYSFVLFVFRMSSDRSRQEQLAKQRLEARRNKRKSQQQDQDLNSPNLTESDDPLQLQVE